VDQEILGSSLGEPSLVVELAETPVLPDTLELRVREQLSEDEKDALEEERRRSIQVSGRPTTEAPRVVKAPGIEGDWVLWSRVDSFIGADGDARVYRLDPATGRVTFGNGRQGKVPPAGIDAIRAFRYQQGGGPQGNAPAWSDLALKSALEGIESVVLPVDAAGGVDNPKPVTLLDSAPARIRHAGRALTVADFEALAVAAAPEVVRARCTSPGRPNDPIRVAIALRDGSRQPVPSLALRASVARTLRAAGWGGLPARKLRVVPPSYVPVRVAVRLRVPAALAAQVEQVATAALVELLHPTDGGPDGRGWPFGHRVWESDVLRALHGVDGIDRVESVELSRRDGRPLDAMPADGLVCAAVDDVDVQVEPVVEP
jgi:predicted phage baseplate assembly protein